MSQQILAEAAARPIWTMCYKTLSKVTVPLLLGTGLRLPSLKLRLIPVVQQDKCHRERSLSVAQEGGYDESVTPRVVDLGWRPLIKGREGRRDGF